MMEEWLKLKRSMWWKGMEAGDERDPNLDEVMKCRTSWGNRRGEGGFGYSC